jgi:hypothetical protein
VDHQCKVLHQEAQAAITVLETDLFEKVLMESPMLLDVQGNAITSAGRRVRENMAITATLVNDEQVSQSFMFIVQVINEDGAVSSILLTLGSLQPGESLKPSVSWLPKEQGPYTAEIFVWSSLSSPSPLVEKQTVAINIIILNSSRLAIVPLSFQSFCQIQILDTRIFCAI